MSHCLHTSYIQTNYTFDSLFPTKGKQGIVGLLKHKTDVSKPKVVFKISKHIDSLIKHEYIVGQNINNINNVSMHCVNTIGIIQTYVDMDDISTSLKTLESKNQHNETLNLQEILLLEYIDNTHNYNLYKTIKDIHIPEHKIMNWTKQSLASVCMLQQGINFTHYDLHSKNILIQDTDMDIILYNFDNKNQLCVPSSNKLSKIIDFGYSYSENVNFLYSTLFFTSNGFTGYKYDHISDFRVLLNSLLMDLRIHRGLKNSQITQKLHYFIRTIFKPLSLDNNCGWLKYKYQHISEIAVDMIYDNISSDINDNSILFDDINDSVELIHSLIELPFRKRKFSSISSNYVTFYKEFSKIEKSYLEVKKNTVIIILKHIVEEARKVKQLYFSGKKQNLNKAYEQFHKSLSTFLELDLKELKVNSNILLCSLFSIVQNLEGIFFHYSQLQEKFFKKKYYKMKIKNMLDVLLLLEIHIPSKYTFTPSTKILYSNNVTHQIQTISNLNEKVCSLLNSHTSIHWGKILYQHINNS